MIKLNTQHYVLGFALSADKKKVLLIRKKRPVRQADLLNGVGGKIETFDETPQHAMAREFQEETTLHTQPTDWKHYTTLSGPGYCVYVFYATPKNINEYQSPTDEEVNLIPIEALKIINYYGCMSNLNWLIAMLADNEIDSLKCEVTYC